MKKYINITPKSNQINFPQEYIKEISIQKFRTQPKTQKKNNLYEGLSRQKVKTLPSNHIDKISTRAKQYSVDYYKNQSSKNGQVKTILKLPPIKINQIQQENKYKNTRNLRNKIVNNSDKKHIYYSTKMYNTLRNSQGSYINGLYRQHFYHYIQIFRLAKHMRIKYPKRIIKLQRKCNNNFKTVYLDLDETLIHCDQNPSKKYTVTLNFPLQNGNFLAAGVNIRPYCKQFLKQLSKFAQIIIFTASSSSYADVILDYLDPNKNMISHRLYRQHCTFEKGFYLKDLRSVNRNIQNVVLVDNSPYCHLLQPQNAVPIIPFYFSSKDNELQQLLEYLKQLFKKSSIKEEIQKDFYWNLFLNQYGNLPALFMINYEKR